MESLRDVRRVMEREVKKGSCPIMFDRLEFGTKPFQTITSEEKLDEVLAWLLRVKSFRQYAEKTIINNVYMDLDLLCKNPQFKRTHSVTMSCPFSKKKNRHSFWTRWTANRPPPPFPKPSGSRNSARRGVYP